MIEKKKPGHDRWRDYSQDIYTFILELQKLGFELILIIGAPGTGKTSGMRALEPQTNIWYNCDNKNPVWEGGKEIYGKKTSPIAPYHVIPESYSEIISHIKVGLEKGMFAIDRYAFITGHTENFKEGEVQRVRLKTLGQLTNKMQIEGKLETVLYTNVEKDGDKTNYILETQNSGYNTARSHQNMFEGKIENDYNFILEKLTNY
jgi:hypothetical protein